MSSTNRSLGLAALGWWLAARGLSEPIHESFFRLDPAGVQRLGKAGRVAALATVRRLAEALREGPAESLGQAELFTQGGTWLDRLDTVLNAPRVGLRIEKALTGDAEDFDALIAVELAEERSVMLAARLAEWLHAQVGTDVPAALAILLAQGWPLAHGSQRRVSFVQEFLANLQMELSDAPAEITLPLGEATEFIEWLQSAAGYSPESTPLELPPPTPAAPPTPPIEVPATSEPVAEPEVEAVDEAPAETVETEPISKPREHTQDDPPPPREPEVPPTIYEDAAREHRRLRSWALVAQVGWVVLLFAGWRVFQQHRAATPRPVAKAISPAPSPSPVPALEKAAPIAPRLTVPAPSVPIPTASPLPPAMSVGKDELGTQAQTLAAAGHHAEAVALFRRLVQVQAQDKSLGRLPRALVYARMAASLAALDRLDEADASVERAQALLEELLPTHDAETALGVEMVGDYWASRERWPLAARLYQKAVQTYENTPAENSMQQLSTVNRLAGALRQIGELKQSEALYRQLEKAYAGAGSAVATDAASAAHNLANVLLITNRAGEALRHYEQAFTWLAKAPPSDEQAKRMVPLMQSNYERCLAATGLPPEEARERAQKAASRKAQ